MKNLALFIPEIRALFQEGKREELKKLLSELHPADIANGFEVLDEEEQVNLFKMLNDEQAVSVFEKLKFEQRASLLESLSKDRIAKVVDEMAPDERADLFGELSEEVVERLFSLMKKEEVEDVVQLLKYEKDTAGGIMTTDFIALQENMSVEEAGKRLRGASAEIFHYIYVTDEAQRLVGVVPIRAFITAPPKTQLKDIMERNLLRVDVKMDQEEVARLVADYDLIAVPVVEEGDRLVGVITVDDVIDVLEEEATEDMFKMTGIYIEEEEAPKIPIIKGATTRLLWLSAYLLGGLIAGGIIKLFQVTISEVVAFAFFIPLVMGLGGNVGVQSSTVIVRGMATGWVNPQSVRKILLKEIGTGLLMGIACGVGIGVVAPLLKMASHPIGFIVGTSIFLSFTAAAFIGTLLPILLDKLKIDPATASGPVITGTADVVGVLIYFSLAMLLLDFLR